MTRSEIDAMCIEAVRDAERNGESHIRYRFAALVAAAEREACAQVCESLMASEWVSEEAGAECADAIRAGSKP